MEKTFKKVRVSLLGALALTLGLGIVNINAPQASADTVADTFEMKYGASIRLTESADDAGGIRFETIVGSGTYDAVFDGDGNNKEGMEIGMFVVPASYYDDFADAEYGGTYYEYFSEVKGKIIDQKYAANNLIANDDGTYTMRMSLVDVLFNNMNTEFVALGYVATTTGESVSYRYADFSLNGARSMAHVAAKAAADYDVASYLDNSVLKTLGVSYNATTQTYAYDGGEYATVEEVKQAVASFETDKETYGKDYILSNRESYLVKNGKVQYKYLVVPDSVEIKKNNPDVVYQAAETIKNTVYKYNGALLTTINESSLNGRENGLIYVGQTTAQPAIDALGAGGYLISHDADKDNLHVVAKSNDYLVTAVAELLAGLTDNAGDYMVGSALKGSMQTVVDTLKVNVSKQESANVLSDSLQGVTSLKCGATELAFDATEGLTLTDASTLGYGEQLLTATTEIGKVNIYANVVDKLITTEAEFLKLFDYLTMTKDETNYVLTFDGHIALGANLDFSNMANTDYAGKAKADFYGTGDNRQGFGWASYSEVAGSTGGSNGSMYTSFYNLGRTTYEANYKGKNVGFIGTFDGQGYTIKGLTIAALGIFPSVGTNGVIKNVAFADTTLGAYAYMFGAFCGTMENVLVDIKATAGVQEAGICMHMDGTVKNSIVYFPAATSYDGSHFGVVTLTQKNRSFSNFYSIGNANASVFGNVPVATALTLGYYFDTVDNFNANISVTTWKTNIDTNVWDVESHVIPVFKTYNGTNIAVKA